MSAFSPATRAAIGAQARKDERRHARSYSSSKLKAAALGPQIVELSWDGNLVQFLGAGRIVRAGTWP